MNTILVAVATSAALLGVRPEPGVPENVRLRAHFDAVDAELRAADISALTANQRTSRARMILWLRAYRDAERFPRNDRFPDRAMPFFRDSDGVLCAMAYLIDRSGRGDLVERIARTKNHAFIADLASEPELLAWLDVAGLTIAEAARIQPTYPSAPRLDSLLAQYDSAWIAGDSDRLGRLLAAEYRYVGPDGEARSRTEMLRIVSAADFHVVRATRPSLVLPDVGGTWSVTVTTRWVTEGTAGGIAFTRDYRCTQIWNVSREGWQIVSERCLRHAGDGPP